MDFLAFRLNFIYGIALCDFDNDGMVNGADFLPFRQRFLLAI